jgi:hypothetical protein
MIALPTFCRQSGKGRNPAFYSHHGSQKQLASTLHRLESSVRISTSRCFLSWAIADIHCQLEVYIQ